MTVIFVHDDFSTSHSFDVLRRVSVNCLQVVKARVNVRMHTFLINGVDTNHLLWLLIWKQPESERVAI